MEKIISIIVERVTNMMDMLGSPGLALIIAFENLFPPIPSEVILPLAGLAASQGKMNLISAILWATIGSVTGALILYSVGALFGRERTRAIAAKVPLIKMSDIDKTEAWFARHGVKTVFFGRMIPIFRSLISIPAGIERMPITTFLLFTALGSLLWNTIFILAGYILGDNWQIIITYADIFKKAVIVGTILVVIGFIAQRLYKLKKRTI